MRDPEITRKLIDLESALGLLQHDFEQQNRVLLEDTKRLDRLENTLRHLASQFEMLRTPAEPRTLEDDRPPHY